MSTTHSTPDNYPSHTVVGSPPSRDGASPTNTAIVLLNRSSRLLRRELLSELVDAGFREIVTVEAVDRSFTVESLSREFPHVRFILVDDEINPGESINLAVEYLQASYFFVLWSTMSVPTGVQRGIEAFDRRRVCVAPILRGERSEALPTAEAPALHRRGLRILPLPVRGDGSPTIFPFDYVALYGTQRFRDLGGYDSKIAHPFWQKLDFGFRIHIAGGDIPIVPTVRISYKSMPEPEDQTIDTSYARFYAKNLAVRVGPQGGTIPFGAVFSFALRSRMGLFASLQVFREVRQWLIHGAQAMNIDPRDVVEGWSVEHE